MRNIAFSSCEGGTMNKEKKEVPIRENSNFKDTLFRMIFKEPNALLQLYNAVSGSDYTDATALEIVTLENAIYMSMKNDLAFLVDCRLNLYEHQSSVNPNMPLRDLFYVANEYQSLVNKKSLYASKLVKIPTPSFVVFYNGRAEQAERLELKLSDAFSMPTENPALELKVVQLNIKAEHNKGLLAKCPMLDQYSQYVDRVQRYARSMELSEAVAKAVQECIKEGILSDFLSRNKAEAISVSIFEYDEEKELAMFGEAEREVGMELGELSKMVSLIRKKQDKGMSAEEIAKLLEEDEDLIKNILKVMGANSEANDREVARIILEII